MANAKRCDRCNKFYDNQEIIENYNTNMRLRYGVIKDCHPQGEVRFDLCKSCRIELVEWFNSYDL